MQIGSIHWALKLHDEQFKRAMAGVSAKMHGLRSAMERTQKGSKMMLMGTAAAGAGIAAFAVSSVKAYNESARREAELIQLHQKNTGATEAQTKSLFKLAAQTQAKGVIDDDAIVAGQAQLATFKMSTQSIKNLTPAMADMVAKLKGVNATGDDFTNIGNLMGKVMEGNVGALRRYGVSFTDAQEAMLKNGTETEKSAVLAEVLAANYGGVNKALRNTPQGQLKALKNTIGDLQEGLGMLILKALDPVVKSFAALADKITKAGGFMKYMKKLWAENQQKITMIAGAIMASLVPALIAMAASLWAALWPIGLVMAAGALLGLAIKKIADKMGGFDKLWSALAKTFKVVKDIIVVVAKVLKAAWDKFIYPALQGWGQIMLGLWNFILKPIFNLIVSVVKKVMKWWQGLSDKTKKIFKTIAIVVGALVVAFAFLPITIALVIGYIVKMAQKFKVVQKTIKAVWTVISTIIKFAWEKIIKPVFTGIIWAIKNVLIPAFNAIWTVIQFVWSAIQIYIQVAWTIIVLIFDLIKGYIENVLIPVFNTIWTAVKFVWDKIYEGLMWLWNTVLKPIWDLIISYINNILLPVWRKIADVVKSVWNKVSAGISAAWNFIKPIFEAVWNYITETLVPIFTKIWNTVKNVFTKVWSFISGAWDKVKAGFDKVKGWITNLISVFTGIKDKITGAFSGAGKWLVDIGKDIINGLMDGAKSILKKIGEIFLKVIPGWIKDPFKKALGIKSPSKVFAGYGQNIIEGLAGGLEKANPVAKQMNRINGMLTADMSANLAGIGSLSRSAQFAATSNITANLEPITPNVTTVHVDMSKVMATTRQQVREVGKVMIEAVNEELVAKGKPPIANDEIRGSA